MKTLYPDISPFHTFFLETDSEHRVYVEQSGNPAGIPAIFLHGGPCSGTKPDHRRFFDPERYHIILMDQRGCGLSEPFGELQGNTTQDLLADMERIRTQLRIDSWLLFGGSWGGTLALLYAQQHPTQVLAMILRGVFLARQADMEWFLGNGVNKIYPERWQILLDALPNLPDANVLERLVEAIFGADQDVAKRAAQQWQAWSGQVALGNDYLESMESVSEQMLRQVKMELSYAIHDYFIRENQILENCAALQSIPTIIIHGRNDLTCPIEAGWRLHQALPQSRYVVLPNAGHIARGDEMIDALVSATDEMARLLA
ncbi:prolyl aminopeptidase [Methylomonas sp. BW4-1]|uniref:prolyl aminopeptidase n=1 Tax=unclassified Methylomonas TaxID=2608980 RepID=UPI001967B7C5|nr:prolyl aminopeptidase [Methylomonas sp. EFPC1]QSB00932.1 prolyl aminopeptidase [Methylomonas sp. EFPC1]